MNQIVNGSFLENIVGWNVAGWGATEPSWNTLGNPSGSMKIAYGEQATQTITLYELGAEYTVRAQLSVPDPGTATGEFGVRVTQGSAYDEELVPIPFADAGWYSVEFTFIASQQTAVVQLANQVWGGPDVYVDNVSVERVAISPLLPLVAELQKRRRDIISVKHAAVRYAEMLTRAVANAPLHIWHHKYTDIQTTEGVLRYAFSVLDLVNPDHIFKVGMIRADGYYQSIGRYTALHDDQFEGGIEIRLDEPDWTPAVLRVEYKAKPFYDFSLPDELPLDEEWVLADAMTRLLYEADPSLEQFKLIERDLAYWTAQRDRREASIQPRQAPGLIRTTPAFRFSGVGREASTAPAATTVRADFTASPTKNYTVPAEVAFVDRSTGATGWSWEFGDGNTSTEQNPIHTYYGVGNYTVTLYVTGPGGSDAVQRYEFIQVGIPDAKFAMLPETGSYPLFVQFENLTTFTEPEGNISWLWNFGDGYTSTLKNPSHTFGSVGAWQVALTATGSVGSDTEIRTVVVTEQPVAPLVDFSAVPVTGNVPLAVQFTPIITGNYTGVEWDFGDGSALSNEMTPTHTYTVIGTYTPKLTVAWTGGAPVEASKTDYIDAIASGEPVAAFHALETSVYVGQNVRFRDDSTPEAEITGWDWDFGDSAGVSLLQNPEYAYDTEGIYTVTLEVTSPGGTNTTEIVNYITVNPLGTSRVGGEIWLADFNEGTGDIINDRTTSPYNLTFTGTRTWGDGKLTVTGDSRAEGTGAPTKIINALQASEEMTFEAWLKSASSTTLRRLIDIAVGSSDVNLQIRQNDEDRFRGYLRSTTSNNDGSPELETGPGAAITTEDYQHLIMRRFTDGTWELIIDNDSAVPAAAGSRDGSFSAWNAAAEFVLFNQVGTTRGWLGDIYLAAIYDWALSDLEIEQNYFAGPEGSGPPPPPGDTYYVTKTGSDSTGDGSLTFPWATINYGASQMGAGDTLYVGAGTYVETVDITVSGTSGSRILIKAYPGATPIIEGPNNAQTLTLSGAYVDAEDFYAQNDNALSAVDLGGSNNRLSNLLVGTDKTKAQATSNSYGITLTGDDCTIEDCEVRGFRDGIRIQNSPRRFVIQNNHIHTMKKMPFNLRNNAALVLGGLIKDNLVWNAGEDGVGATSHDPPAHKGIYWTGNVFVDCSENAIDQKSMELMVFDNNLFMRAWGVGDAGINVEPPYGGSFPSSEIPAGKERSVLGTFTRGAGDSAAKDRGIIYRRNVFIDTAQPLRFMDGSTPNENVDLKMYNNTIIACNRDYTGYDSDYGGENIGRGGMVAVRTQDNSQGIRCYWINNLVVDQNWAMVALKVDQHVCDANLYFESGAEAEQFAAEGTSFDWELMTFAAWRAKYSHEALSISGSDPLLVNAPARPDSDDWAVDAFKKTADLLAVYDVRLDTGSPAIGAGLYLTLVAANSSGTTIEVDDSMFFCDGWDNPAIPADVLKIGTDTVTEYTIVSIDYDTHEIELDQSVAVSIGDKVFLTYNGTGPDIGAYEAS